MIERAEHGVQWAKSDSGYIQIEDSLRPVAASAIMSNNIWVSTMTFAGGITGGLLTAYALAMNGIDLGAVLGLYQSKGILSLILRFVAPHGVLELTAITFSGAAGLLIASAFLMPGAMTRREALIVRGRRAIRLVAATVLLLVVAGSIEGLLSPIPSWTLAEKLSVSAATAVLLAIYIVGRRPARTDDTRPASLAAAA
jgi:uncharacterized membrane protein SpoIIM required for sporulation